jgi:hypothetical protein
MLSTTLFSLFAYDKLPEKLFMKFLQTNAPEKLLSFSATLSTSQQVKDELE